MKKLIQRLWAEDVGAVVSAEIMLVATVLVLGSIVGLSSVRDSVVTELADVAQGVSNLNQSYSYGGVSGTSSTSNTGDTADINGQSAKGVNVASQAFGES